MRVLITGGAGFVGSHLCERYLKDGWDVIAVDNLSTGDQRNVDHLLSNPRFSYMTHDVVQPLDIDGELDAILHFASPASPPIYLKMPLETMRVSSTGTENLLELALRKNAKILLASTSEIYGDPLEHPQNEDYFGNVDLMGPRAIYDEAKRYAETLMMAYHRVYGVETRIIRIFNTYGPRMSMADGRVVPNFIAQAIQGKPLTVYGTGEQTRSFQYVDDLVEGIVRLLASDYRLPVNIGNPHEITIVEFAEIVLDVCGNTNPIVYEPESQVSGDPKRRRPDITRAKEILDWEPRVDLRDGLAETVEYFRQVLAR